MLGHWITHFSPQFTADTASTVCLTFAARQKAERLPVNVHRKAKVLQGLPLVCLLSRWEYFLEYRQRKTGLVLLASRELTVDHKSLEDKKAVSHLSPYILPNKTSKRLLDLRNANTVCSNAGIHQKLKIRKQHWRKGPTLQALSKRRGNIWIKGLGFCGGAFFGLVCCVLFFFHSSNLTQ